VEATSGDNRPTTRSTLLAFLLAPLATVPATAALLTVACALGLGSFKDAPPVVLLTSLMMIAVFEIPVAYTAALFLGLPAFAFAKRRGLLSLGHALATGTAVAVLPLILYCMFVTAYDGLGVVRDAPTALAWMTLFIASGASAGVRSGGSPSDRERCPLRRPRQTAAQALRSRLGEAHDRPEETQPDTSFQSSSAGPTSSLLPHRPAPHRVPSRDRRTARRRRGPASGRPGPASGRWTRTG